MAQQKWALGDIRPAQHGMVEREHRSRSRQRGEDAPPSDRGDGSDFSAPGESAAPRSGRRRAPARGRRKLLFLSLFVLILAGIGFLSTLFFKGAELIVYPKLKEVTVQATFTAFKAPEAGALGYELLTLEETGERTIAATGVEKVSDQARGEITLYNSFSTEPQRLIKNTRFESPDGKIFKIQDSVTVPGYTTDTGGGKAPGATTAKVFADTAGDAYNIGPAHFTIPGLKDTPQFDTMYAESKAPMQGGFVGDKLIVEPTELIKVQEAVRAELTDRLLGRMRTERPAGFELYESAARVRFESLPSVDAGEKQATLREKAVLEAPLFAEDDFARYLAKNTVVEYKDEPVRLDNPQSLTFSYVAATSSDAAPRWDKIDFTLSGNAKIVWTYDTEKLRSDIAGAAKADVSSILLSYQPAIERATAIMRPFWKRSFPDNPEKIKIVEMLDAPTTP